MNSFTRPLSSLSILFVLCASATAHEPKTKPLPDAHALLVHAQELMGLGAMGDKVLHLKASRANSENYQSDRSYPPFLYSFNTTETWFDPRTGIERTEGRLTFPGIEMQTPVTFSNAVNTLLVARGKATPAPRQSPQARNLHVWAVLADWIGDSNVKAVGREVFRDYLRLVLTRTTEDGEQRLFMDEKTGLPVKLDLIEPHYLWGQRRVEYIYSNWTLLSGSFALPASSSRMADGDMEFAETLATAELVERKGAPDLALPATNAKAESLPLFLRAIPPTTTQVSQNTYLLSNPGYNELVTLVGNDLYVFDATQSEDRARQDAQIIHKLFPGKHPVNVVVTDLAWPHVAGVRYWVASGATIISHSAARTFLQKVIDRRWTLSPDLLEKARSRRAARFKFVPVEQQYSMAGGSVALYAIDGIGSEIALMAYLPGEHLLWASDYIQTIEEPSLYMREVWNAAQRANIQPERVAAEHLPLTQWSTVATIVEKSNN